METQNIEVTDTGTTMKATIPDNVTQSYMTEEQEEGLQQAVQEAQVEDNKASEPQQDIQSAVDQQLEAEKALASDLKARGIDFDALSNEYDEKGELSPESYAKLEKAGYPRQVVDAYVNGLEAMASRFVNQVQEMAGGAKGYEQLSRFISTQPQSVIDGFNQAISSGNLNQIQLTINGLMSQMRNTYGTANPTLMSGQAGATQGGYTTVEQMTKDMADPRYQKDPKFTREVMYKIQNGTIFG